MIFAYADPPYLGQGTRYGYPEWDTLPRHAELVAQIVAEYPDGWALSLSTPSLRAMLNLCPEDVRVGGWFKPFASFKPNVNPAYAWEPVIWRGGRKRDRTEETVRDWHSANITLRRGLTGAKPASFCRWIADLLGYRDGLDTMDDLFPGTHTMAAALAQMTFAGAAPTGSGK